MIWWAVAATMAVVPAATTAKPYGPPRLREHGAERLVAPGAAQSPDGCALSVLFDDMNYARSAGTAPKPLLSRREVWRLTLKAPARASEAKVQLRGMLANTPGVSARVGLAFAGPMVWRDMPATDPHGGAPPADIPAVSLKMPSSSDWVDLTLILEVRETAEAKGSDSLAQLDSLDLTFEGCRAAAKP